ncbi:MAG: NADH-quinone oxidoreductase subunit J [Flavobacteriia bacterium]|nr:NADH-quinone oxidoreductase subunit J [Flavobacteriia bacterium]
MELQYIAYLLGGLTLGSALMVVLSPHPVRSVLYLIITFFLISANYILMNAQFIAIVNIIVYAGAIMVLFLFVLMMLNLSKETEPKSSIFMKIAAIIAGGGLLTVFISAIKKASLMTPSLGVDENLGLVKELGNVLFKDYILPFEISSVLFIAAMVGAVLLAKREKQIID